MMMQMITTRKALLICLMALVLAAGLALAQEPAQEPDPLAKLVATCGLEVTKLADDAWNIPFDVGKDKPLNVIVSYHDDEKKFALIFTTVVDRKDNFQFNQNVLQECMKLNGEYPVAKFSLDPPAGNLDCEIQTYIPALTAETLRLYASFVASIADENRAKLEQLAGQ